MDFELLYPIVKFWQAHPRTLLRYPQSSAPNASQLQRLANLVVSRYNRSLGLVYESVKVNDTFSKKPASETYWLENDNGQAAYALAPYWKKQME
ncbi:MAG: hypothetical protein ACHQ1H_14545 [Nitrososphaerales archaeon]